MYFFVIFKAYVADLPIMHCLNIGRCMIVYLDFIIIMRFQNKLLLSLPFNGFHTIQRKHNSGQVA